ncbi:MAG: EamA family transporter [Limosilactobacillus pontis]
MTFYYAIQRGTPRQLQFFSTYHHCSSCSGIVFMHRRPFRSDIIAFVIALLSCLEHHPGNITKLAIPFDSLMWGIGSGITAAFYVVLPQKAAEKIRQSSFSGTMIAGILFNLYRPFWINPPQISTTLVASVGTVVLFGTILPFGLLMEATKFAPSDVVSIMDALQPIVTSVLSVIFFHLVLNWVEILGIILVILAIYILQEGRRRKLKNV